MIFPPAHPPSGDDSRDADGDSLGICHEGRKPFGEAGIERGSLAGRDHHPDGARRRERGPAQLLRVELLIARLKRQASEQRDMADLIAGERHEV